MIRRWNSVPLLALLAALLAGCEPMVEPTPAPAADLASQVERQVLLSGSATTGGTVVDAQGHEYTVVQAPPPPLLGGLQVSGLLNAVGGVLQLAGHALTVPAGAVSRPTVFVMMLLPDGRVEVELRALSLSLFGLLNVGGRGFDEPVEVTLSYADATNVGSGDQPVILYLPDDGPAVPIPSTVDPVARTVTAQLDHFSRYCMAIP